MFAKTGVIMNHSVFVIKVLSPCPSVDEKNCGPFKYSKIFP